MSLCSVACTCISMENSNGGVRSEYRVSGGGVDKNVDGAILCCVSTYIAKKSRVGQSVINLFFFNIIFFLFHENIC